MLELATTIRTTSRNAAHPNLHHELNTRKAIMKRFILALSLLGTLAACNAGTGGSATAYGTHQSYQPVEYCSQPSALETALSSQIAEGNSALAGSMLASEQIRQANCY
jgi:hypothetical protein